MQRGKFCQTMRVATSIFVGLRIHAPVQSPKTVLLVGLGRGLIPAMQHHPPPKPQCFAAAGRAGFEELRKPSANLGPRLGLAALARILNPARPCFRDRLGSDAMAYASSTTTSSTCYGCAAPSVASTPVLSPGITVEQQRAWQSSMPARFEHVFGPVLHGYVDGWRALFSRLESKGYCNDVETQYERGIDALRREAATGWNAAWAHALEELQLPAASGEAVFQAMAMAWPDAMMLLAHGAAELDWTSPTNEEIKKHLTPAARQQGAYTFGWAVLRAVEHAADRLQQQGSDRDPIDVRAANVLDSVRLTVSQARAAPRSQNLGLVNELDRATTERGGLFRLSLPGQAAMQQVSGHFRKWLTFENFGRARHKFSLLTEVIARTKAAPTVRAAVRAMIPPELRDGSDCDAVTARLLDDLLKSYSKMEGKSFAGDLNDHLAERLQNAVALRKQVKMAALRRQFLSPEQKQAEATAKAVVKASKQHAAAAARDEAKRLKQETSLKRKREEAVTAVREGGFLALEPSKLDVKKLKVLVRSFGIERVPTKRGELLQLYEAYKPEGPGPRRGGRVRIAIVQN
jgi:hypothetical protein